MTDMKVCPNSDLNCEWKCDCLWKMELWLLKILKMIINVIDFVTSHILTENVNGTFRRSVIVQFDPVWKGESWPTQ